MTFGVVLMNLALETMSEISVGLNVGLTLSKELLVSTLTVAIICLSVVFRVMFVLFKVVLSDSFVVLFSATVVELPTADFTSPVVVL